MTMAIDTDMAAAFDVEKIPPTIVAASALVRWTLAGRTPSMMRAARSRPS
jgi:hypothetical protein